MIISCPSCLKKFKIEETLIPSKGRNLQCGSCNYNWFYKIENKTVEPHKLEENIEEKIEDSDESVLISSTSKTLKLDVSCMKKISYFRPNSECTMIA